MFICRSQLLRAHSPKHIVLPHTPRLITPKARQYAQLNLLDLLYRNKPVDPSSATAASGPTSQPRKPRVHPRFHALPNPTPDHSIQEITDSWSSEISGATLKPAAVDKSTREVPLVVKDYLRMRQYNPQPFLKREPLSFIPLLKAITFFDLLDVLDCFVTDVVKSYAPHNPEHGLELIMIICKYCLIRRNFLTREQVRSLLFALRDTGQLKQVPRRMRVRIARSLISMYDDPVDIDTIDMVVPLLVDILTEGEANKEETSRAVWPLYCVTQRLIVCGHYQKALNIFHVLVQTHNVVTSSITPTDLAEQDFAAVVSSSLVRSCLEDGRYVRAKDLLLEAIEHNRSATGTVSAVYRNVTSDLIIPLLTTASDPDVAGAAILIRLLMEFGELNIESPFKRSPLYHFYRKAHIEDKSHLVEEVYAYSQTDEIASKAVRKYPPPPRETLLWFLEALCNRSRNKALARTLVTQVVEENSGVPVHDRADFVGLAASNGFANAARTLWTRYAKAPNQRLYVVGNSAMVLRLVSVFASLMRREGIKSRDKDVFETFPWLKKKKFRPRRGTRNLLRSVPALRSSSEDTQSASADESVIASDTVREEPLALSNASGPADGQVDAEEIKDSAQELRAFAEVVMAEFRKTLGPFEQASHESLSALARAYFMLGSHEEGFKVFQTMLGRYTILDIYDVNVVLAAMAHHNPSDAMLMLERMVGRNMRLDAISFGTIIHYALLHGEREVVSAALVRAKQLGVNELTFKTLGALLHATASTPSQGNATDALHEVKDIVRALITARHMPTPEMGVDAVKAAIRAGSPRPAFYFWKMLVKDRTEWHDRAQKKLRAKIADCVCAHYRRGWLEHDIGQSMLVQLDEGSMTRRLYDQGQRGEGVASDSDTSPVAHGKRESQ